MLSEDTLIARYLAPIAGTGGLGLLDDAAVLSPPVGHDLVVTQDALVAGLHFFADDPPASIARKALRVNLSDLAAKGAVPAGFLLAFALPKGIDEAWIAPFAAALGEDAQDFGCQLLGGDTVRASGGLTLSITALGYCPTGRMVRRTTGQPGHVLAVTGTIGDSALGLQLRLTPDAAWARTLSAGSRQFLADRYLHPRPRNALALAIREYVGAAMDVSDGLLGDAVKLAAAAGSIGIAIAPRIDLGAIPLSAAAREALSLEPALIDTIATGGDDYEVLMAVEPDRLAGLTSACGALGCAVTPIGTLCAGQTPAFTALDGSPVRFGKLKFEHEWQR
ncbi:MAG: thiamine-phosphate kinase [Hyphomicrobiales bacterium]|nr:thiamine-phosphate kinase [Hyphomicrobiales bacterium]